MQLVVVEVVERRAGKFETSCPNAVMQLPLWPLSFAGVADQPQLPTNSSPPPLGEHFLITKHF
jgi:hypothetical protein